MSDETETKRGVLDRIRAAAGAVRRAFGGGGGGDDGVQTDPRLGTLHEHEQNKMDEFVERAEEQDDDEEPGRGDPPRK